MKLVDRVSQETGLSHEKLVSELCALEYAELKTVYCNTAACDTCREQEDPEGHEILANLTDDEIAEIEAINVERDEIDKKALDWFSKMADKYGFNIEQNMHCHFPTKTIRAGKVMDEEGESEAE